MGEGTNLLAVYNHHANQFVLFQHWNCQKRSHAAKFNCSHEGRIAFDVALPRSKIMEVNDRFSH